MSYPTTTCRTCPNCDEPFCLQCEMGGPCKECGREMCIICYTVSHSTEAQGACCMCYTPGGSDIVNQSGQRDFLEAAKRKVRGN